LKLLCLDTETTGVDVFEDRIVTVFAGVLDTETGEWDDKLNLLVNPGIDIPEGAAAVHGISTRVARGFGVDPQDALEDLTKFISEWGDLPVVVMNANYDLSLIDSELSRYSYEDFGWSDVSTILDPLVIDRHHDRYRKGSRKLVDLARHYGVEVDDSEAHDAAYDCYLAGSVAAIQIERYGMPTNEEQAQWYADWATNFQEYLRKKGSDDIIDTNWPIRVKGE
jgi:DNA polymerase III subunit epsilon